MNEDDVLQARRIKLHCTGITGSILSHTHFGRPTFYLLPTRLYRSNGISLGGHHSSRGEPAYRHVSIIMRVWARRAKFFVQINYK